MSMVIYGWIPGGLATLLMLYAVFITFQASKRLAGDLKLSVNLLLCSLIAYWVMGVSVGVLLVKEISVESWLWWMYLPVLALIGAFSFVVGARTLFFTLENVAGNKK